MSKYNWPTREEWAERVRTAYTDDMPDASNELSNYANAEEIEAAIAALKDLYRDYGHQMKAAQQAAGSLPRRRGEHLKDWLDRVFAMSKADEDLVREVQRFQDNRRMINVVLKELREGRVSWHWEHWPPLATIMARKHAADEAAREAYIAKCAARPIDDAAWEKHLEWRRRVDGEGIFIVNAGRLPPR